ncbi:hypothetical protein [Desulfobulbus alkaliphilus]|uniref:hypothetical protein n=1 Tax=Desulfobulbus alkaliphilus TaxID=869814 RepID=UPI0019659F2D|nr:hypothetical protein [Desulfobulbus alkaliphilus]MBM9538284.1 hypothetical protein [Desulfobulbus alkaliphilus]
MEKLQPDQDGRRAAAREAATRYAVDMTAAVALFASLTGRAAAWANGENREALMDELCSLLPAYRHPVHDASTEYILFINPAGLPPNGPAPVQAGNTREAAYQSYLALVRRQGLSRRAAVEKVACMHGYTGYVEALQALREEQEEVVRRWQKSAPCLTETIQQRWRGLLPET